MSKSLDIATIDESYYYCYFGSDICIQDLVKHLQFPKRALRKP